jgi:hypothetical protein
MIRQIPFFRFSRPALGWNSHTSLGILQHEGSVTLYYDCAEGLAELLRSQQRWGRTRTRKFLLPLALSENRQLGRLTIRQREVLARELEGKRRRG